MPFGKKYQRFSQSGSRISKAKRRSTRKPISSTFSSYKRPSGKKLSFNLASLKSIRLDDVKHFLRDLFTTKEGWKKIGLTGLVGFGILGALFIWYSKDLPTPNKINAKISAQSTQIFDRNGKLLYEIHGDQNRIMADFNEIPKDLRNATIAIEDKDFYHHFGFDIRRIFGAAFYDIISGSKAQGGSTITQQFVKNALLTNDKFFTRKIKEVILSIEIEQRYKKDDILKMYLNEIPYGSNAYGVKVAAKTFFNKDMKDLTLAESATLAALPNAPTYYSPYGSHKDALLERKNLILNLMVSQGYITKDQAEEAKKQELAFSNNPYGSITAPHFVMWVKEQLVEKYGEKTVNEGGLKVYTTLDLEKQQYAEDAVAKNIDKNKKAYNANNGALVSMDPKTGQILAMVGSRDFFDPNIDGNVNVALMGRQPGSSFKPLVYAALMKGNDWGPGSIFYDVKTDFGGGYLPNNYDGSFRGAVTMRKALQLSLNIPAVKAMYLAGMDNVLDTAHAMGITTLNDKSQYGLSLVLGAGEVKLIDHVGAYSVFANNGVKQDTTWLLKIEDSKGKVVDEYKEKTGKKVLDPQIPYLVSNMLSDDASRASVFGAGGPLTLPGRPVAAKTGTTNDYKDAWTMGYTPSLVTGVWVGNNDGTVMTRAGGSIAAAPIWHDYMVKALANTKVEQFSKPSGIKTVTLDAITGKSPNPDSKNTVTDVFASWFKAGDSAGAQDVRIDKATGKLATDDCPAEYVITKKYNYVTAEIPSTDSAYSRWFAPIQAWASANGFATGASLPSEKACSKPETPDNSTSPVTISFINPTNNDVIEKNKNFTVSLDVKGNISKAEITIGANTQTATKVDSYYNSDFHGLAAGNYEILATITDTNGKKATSKITVKVE